MIDLALVLSMIGMVVLSPALIVGTFIFWLAIGHLVSWVTGLFVETEPPSCDIDPLCHPAFVWVGAEGWIGNVKTKERLG